MRVENFRGVAAREVAFAESGVTVIEGDNEAGKSSMMEAFDLLLTTQSSSKSKNVRAVQPSGRDVGTEVSAEISCGPWRFEYFKRFNRQPETALTIIEPVREQLAGREAHERVEQILADSLDKTLFGALRLLQSADPRLGDLANSSALSQALDRAAGEAESDGGESAQTQELVAAVTAEYKKYFTIAQGRPTGELAAAREAASRSASAVAERREILARAQDAADRLPRVAEAIRQLLADEQTGNVEVQTTTAALAEAEAVREQTTAACAVADNRQLVHQVAVDAVRMRERSRAQLQALRESTKRNEHAVAEARGRARSAADRAAEMAPQIAEAVKRHHDLREALRAAEAAAVVASDRARLARLETSLSEIARLQRELAAARSAAEQISVTGDDVRAASTLDRDITAACARLDAVAATVAVSRSGTGEVLVGGDPVDGEVEVAAAALTVVEVPGAARIEIRPGADSEALAGELAALRERETDLLRRCEVERLSDVAPAAARRAEALRQVQELERSLSRELGGAGADDLERQRLDLVGRLPEELPDAGERVDPAELRTDERRASDRVTELERMRDALLAAVNEQELRATTLEESGARIAADLRTLDLELSEAAAAASDEVLAGRVDSAASELDAARSSLAKLVQRLEQLDLTGLREKAAQAEAAQDRLRARLAEEKRLQTELSTKLEVCRSDGRLDELAESVAEDDAAQARLRRVSERAAGARALYETLQRKRNESRARYVDPFTRRLEELAAPVFGDDVSFHIDDDFVITTRTLDGVTVDVDALSGGAKEQLGLLARLACATLVDAADGVPLILDDALGYTDPTRLASMAQVLGTSGGDAQIIVLTCTPDRYREVAGAKLIAV
ncbi:hypothetical protein SCNU_03927 [Gordonia neofelifaecis NRRL B-59395]|uniref:Rad50/SbcC-type AAA domain-containing protein n=1 Tax=Gordonia neofelifaecis NRRL B-59395 TaxID=644548 RepID=F1YFN8_9ACTN|nr:hypothetical protein SCNU_03927 [Gordonia neofelifaecis NRRL B-59395]